MRRGYGECGAVGSKPIYSASTSILVSPSLSRTSEKRQKANRQKIQSHLIPGGFEALVCFWGLTDSTYAGLFSRLLLLRVVPEQHQNQSFIADTGNNKRAERTGSEKKIETAQAHRNRWLAFNV